ncbi:MAG: CbtA family protein [Xanthobacteraceae bacterium]|nr:CbtA family protein [Xanthobacteraceae bacterium]
MVGRLLLRGMLAGVVAGLLAFGFAKVFGEPPIEHAIAFEEHMAHHHAGADTDNHMKGETDESELVSRATQAGLGLFVAVVVYGAAIGGLYALVFAFVYGRFGHLSPRATAALLAAAAFVSFVLVPALKYPANPPAVGDPDTIGTRTALYFAMLVISVAALIFAIGLARSLASRYDGWSAGLVGAAAYVAIVAIAIYVLPAVNEVPEHFSAVVLWNFRVASLGLHAVLWTIVGLLFGFLAERMLAPPPRGRLYQAAIPR